MQSINKGFAQYVKDNHNGEVHLDDAFRLAALYFDDLFGVGKWGIVGIAAHRRLCQDLEVLFSVEVTDEQASIIRASSSEDLPN